MGFLSLFAAPESPFQPPTLAYRLLTSPLHIILSQLHRLLVSLRGTALRPPTDPIRIVCISDTHTHTPSLPLGDLLIHAGDLTNQGTVSEIQAQIDWLVSLPYGHVVFIAGNHDSYFDPRSRRPSDKSRSLDFKSTHYMQHSSVTLNFPQRNNRRMVLYGAPQIPACGSDDFAFQYKRKNDAWSGTVPLEVDVLVTHTPPRWHLDLPTGIGCQHLLEELWRVRPKVHVFGHVHGGRGREVVFWNEGQKAFERLCGRQGWWSLLSIRYWLDVMRVLLSDLLGIVWFWVWGADAEGTIMVNSAHVDYSGQPSFNGHVVEI